MLRSEIETEFDSFITTEFADKPEERKFLLRHERRNLVIRNLCKQVTQVFDRGLDPDRETFKVMIADCSGSSAGPLCRSSSGGRLPRLRRYGASRPRTLTNSLRRWPKN